MHRRQELIPIPKVVLAKLTGPIALLLQQQGKHGDLGVKSDDIPGNPMERSPVRPEHWPVRRADLPAVQVGCAP